jgi:uncharacterized protein (TIGR01777 family)
MLRVTVTGATGLLGTRLVAELRAHGSEVTVLSRDPQRAREKLASDASNGTLEALPWDPLKESAPAGALERRHTVVHLAGEEVAQRWSEPAKRAIRESRVLGTRHLVDGLRAIPAADRPATLISGSAIGYYGARGEEPIDEEAPAGNDFLAQVCREWEEQAHAAQTLGMRVVQIRTGVVLDSDGGALAKMLPAFRLGLGGPVAGGHQYVSWIHPHDHIEILRAAIADERWSGPINATAPTPETNHELARTLGHALHRPALLPVPAFALHALYGGMAQIVTTGARVLPAKALVLGFQFRYPKLEQALAAALA